MDVIGSASPPCGPAARRRTAPGSPRLMPLRGAAQHVFVGGAAGLSLADQLRDHQLAAALRPDHAALSAELGVPVGELHRLDALHRAGAAPAAGFTDPTGRP